MDLDTKKVFKTLNPNKVWIPVIIGLGIIFYLFYTDPEVSADKLSLILHAQILPLIFAFMVLLIRDGGYILRIRSVTGKELSWTSCLYVVILWEFSSAVTPSVVGGTAVAVFILHKEGLNLGKALAYVMITAIFDNMFFIIAAPIVFLITPGDIFPAIDSLKDLPGKSLDILFIVSYSLITLYTLIMGYALLIRPRSFKWLLLKITTIPIFRRWRHGAYEHGNEIIEASSQLKGKGSMYWIQILLLTTLIWCARYLMLNSLMESFSDLSILDHITIFSRQIVMWIIMLISPTPGSSGTAEYFFNQFFKRFLGDYTLVTNIFWRLMSYYPYLILGALFLPRWVRRVFFKKKKQ